MDGCQLLSITFVLEHLYHMIEEGEEEEESEHSVKNKLFSAAIWNKAQWDSLLCPMSVESFLEVYIV